MYMVYTKYINCWNTFLVRLTLMQGVYKDNYRIILIKENVDKMDILYEIHSIWLFKKLKAQNSLPVANCTVHNPWSYLYLQLGTLSISTA